MTRVTPQVARALSLLRSPEFTPLMEYLRARRNETLESLAQAVQHDVVARYQGEARILKDLIELVDKAPELMTKLR